MCCFGDAAVAVSFEWSFLCISISNFASYIVFLRFIAPHVLFCSMREHPQLSQQPCFPHHLPIACHLALVTRSNILSVEASAAETLHTFRMLSIFRRPLCSLLESQRLCRLSWRPTTTIIARDMPSTLSQGCINITRVGSVSYASHKGETP